jgi:hypothetical protein
VQAIDITGILNPDFVLTPPASTMPGEVVLFIGPVGSENKMNLFS